MAGVCLEVVAHMGEATLGDGISRAYGYMANGA